MLALIIVYIRITILINKISKIFYYLIKLGNCYELPPDIQSFHKIIITYLENYN